MGITALVIGDQPVGALWPTSTILLTEVLVLHARAVAGTHTRAICIQTRANACDHEPSVFGYEQMHAIVSHLYLSWATAPVFSLAHIFVPVPSPIRILAHI
eukprot:scaffold157375_cov26-Tisochrysis_lutea.AAC.1